MLEPIQPDLSASSESGFKGYGKSLWETKNRKTQNLLPLNPKILDISTRKKAARILLKTDAVRVDLEEPYEFNQGFLSPIYCDNRVLLSHVEEREKIVKLLLRSAEENESKFNSVAGLATGGIPYAAWLSKALNKPMVYVRGSKKTYGRKKLVEGEIESNQRFLLVDDLVSSGESLIRSVNILRDVGGEVDGCLSIFTFSLNGVEEKFEQLDVDLTCLTDFETVVETERGGRLLYGGGDGGGTRLARGSRELGEAN